MERKKRKAQTKIVCAFDLTDARRVRGFTPRRCKDIKIFKPTKQKR